QSQASAGAIERGGTVNDKFAVFDHGNAGRNDVGQRWQGARRYQLEARHDLPGNCQQEQGKVADQGLLHDRLPCALIASSLTRFQVSSTFSTKNLFLKISGSFLSNLVSTIVLMRPGRADITATR